MRMEIGYFIITKNTGGLQGSKNKSPKIKRVYQLQDGDKFN